MAAGAGHRIGLADGFGVGGGLVDIVHAPALEAAEVGGHLAELLRHVGGGGIDRVGSADLHRQLAAMGQGIDGDDPLGAGEPGAQQIAQPRGAAAEHRHGRSALHRGGDGRRPDAGRACDGQEGELLVGYVAGDRHDLVLVHRGDLGEAPDVGVAIDLAPVGQAGSAVRDARGDGDALARPAVQAEAAGAAERGGRQDHPIAGLGADDLIPDRLDQGHGAVAADLGRLGRPGAGLGIDHVGDAGVGRQDADADLAGAERAGLDLFDRLGLIRPPPDRRPHPAVPPNRGPLPNTSWA